MTVQADEFGYCLDVSIDFSAWLSTPITLAATLSGGRRTLIELLAVSDLPDLRIVADRAYSDGKPVTAGRRLSSAELEAVIVGGSVRVVDEPPDYDIDIAGGHNRVSALVVDHWPHGGVEFVFSPGRDVVSIVVAAAFALATATLAVGQFNDEIGMMRPRSTDPTHVLMATRLSSAGEEFDAACERYLRQFSHLETWINALTKSQGSPCPPIP